MKKRFDPASLPQAEPMVISHNETGIWLHPHLDKLIELYHDEDKSNGTEFYGPWLELELEDRNGEILAIIFRFMETSDYTSFIKLLKRVLPEDHDGDLTDMLVDEDANEALANLIIILIINMVEEIWFPYGKDELPFCYSQYMEDLMDNFNFYDNLTCLSIRPNIAIALGED